MGNRRGWPRIHVLIGSEIADALAGVLLILEELDGVLTVGHGNRCHLKEELFRGTDRPGGFR